MCKVVGMGARAWPNREESILPPPPLIIIVINIETMPPLNAIMFCGCCVHSTCTLVENRDCPTWSERTQANKHFFVHVLLTRSFG